MQFSFNTGWCIDWRPSQHWMFQVANILFFASYSVPTSYYGILFMHSTLIAGIYILTNKTLSTTVEIIIYNNCRNQLNNFCVLLTCLYS